MAAAPQTALPCRPGGLRADSTGGTLSRDRRVLPILPHRLGLAAFWARTRAPSSSFRAGFSHCPPLKCKWAARSKGSVMAEFSSRCLLQIFPFSPITFLVSTVTASSRVGEVSLASLLPPSSNGALLQPRLQQEQEAWGSRGEHLPWLPVVPEHPEMGSLGARRHLPLLLPHAQTHACMHMDMHVRDHRHPCACSQMSKHTFYPAVSNRVPRAANPAEHPPAQLQEASPRFISAPACPASVFSPLLPHCSRSRCSGECQLMLPLPPICLADASTRSCSSSAGMVPAPESLAPARCASERSQGLGRA